jgi:hypothetical protein
MLEFIPLVMLLAYGPLGIMLLLYAIGLALRATGRPQFLAWLVRQTRYERDSTTGT